MDEMVTPTSHRMPQKKSLTGPELRNAMSNKVIQQDQTIKFLRQLISSVGMIQGQIVEILENQQLIKNMQTGSVNINSGVDHRAMVVPKLSTFYCKTSEELNDLEEKLKNDVKYRETIVSAPFHIEFIILIALKT